MLKIAKSLLALRHCCQNAAKKVLPRAKGWPVVGTMLELMAAGGGPMLHLYIDRRHQQLGPIFAESLGPVDTIFISDPKDMRNVFSAEGKYPVHFLPESWLLYNKIHGTERGLFFMNGEEWLKYRQIMNKVMLKSEPSELLQTFQTVTHCLIEEWCTLMPRPVENVIHYMYKLSVSYVIATLIGSSYPANMQLLKSEVEELSLVNHLIFEESSKLNLLPAKMAAKFRLPVWNRFVAAVDTAMARANNLVNLMIPLAASDGILHKMTAEGVSREKIVSITVDLILAAGDTTPYTIIWALYLLARNPEVQSRLAHEAISCPRDQWLSHPLIRAVTRETLRLYPAAPFVTRALASDTLLSGYSVAAGEMIIMSLYTSGRSESNFLNAHKFWPERWLRDDSGNYRGVCEVSASLPFAMGGRSCIGRRVAEAELCLTLGEILTNFHIEVKSEVEMVLKLVPVPTKPVTLHLTKRTAVHDKNDEIFIRN